MILSSALRTTLAVAGLGTVAVAGQLPPPAVTELATADAVRGVDLEFQFEDVGHTPVAAKQAFERATRLASMRLQPTAWNEVAFDPRHRPAVSSPVVTRIDDAPPEGTRLVVIHSARRPIVPKALGVTVAWVDTGHRA